MYALEKEAIELAAEKSDLKVSTYLRRCALGKPVYPRLTEDELKLHQLLVEYHNNFARISNLIRERKDFIPALQEVIGAINHQLQKFNT